jgi:type IV pilus assembly protein PilM
MGKLGKSGVGLDIQPGYAAAVESKAGVEVERAAVATLPPGVVREGEVSDPETLAEVLREMFREHKLPRRVRLGVANQRIVVRTLDLPPLRDAKDIASAVRFQAQEQVPMPLEQAVLEHQTIGTVQTPAGPRTRVVLVAARRDMIDNLLAAVRKAGLRAEGIDLSAFAMIRALHRPGDATTTTLYLSVGGVTNLAVAAGTSCLFTRAIAHGSETLASELAERRGLTLEHAHGWLAHVGLTDELEELDGDPAIVTEARAVLEEGRRRLGDELRNSLDFYRAQEGAGEIERAVLTGPALSIPGFADALGSELGLTLEPGIVRGSRAAAVPEADRCRLAVAAGLTVTEVAA